MREIILRLNYSVLKTKNSLYKESALGISLYRFLFVKKAQSHPTRHPVSLYFLNKFAFCEKKLLSA